MKLTGITGRKNPAPEGDPRFNSLQEWLEWQESLHFTAIELGLDRCRKVAEQMKLLPPSYFVISIAGTNGKGSTSVMLANILQSAGYRVGVYTSPHLLRYNERVKINGTEVEDDLLCSSFNRIDKARGHISLTYFEFGTIAAMDIFQRSGVEIAIMEVGMGGRLDAVNMLDANVSIISTIDIDHEQWLGSDRESIGREKAGIFRPMRPAICADPQPPTTVLQTANLIGANLLVAGVDFMAEVTEECWSWRSGMTRYNRLPFPGNQRYQVQNAAGVLMVLHAIADFFPVQQQTLFECLGNFRMPGRFQLIPGEIPCILDVAHNRQSISALAANINVLPATGRNLMVLGMLKDKNHAACLRELLPHVHSWYLTTLAGPRGASSSDLAAILAELGTDAQVYQFESVAAALVAAQTNARTGDRIIVTGSFITIGDAINKLGLGL